MDIIKEICDFSEKYYNKYGEYLAHTFSASVFSGLDVSDDNIYFCIIDKYADWLADQGARINRDSKGPNNTLEFVEKSVKLMFEKSELIRDFLKHLLEVDEVERFKQIENYFDDLFLHLEMTEKEIDEDYNNGNYDTYNSIEEWKKDLDGGK